MRLRSFALLAALVLLPGCLDEEDVIAVQPDGSGTIHVRQVNVLGSVLQQDAADARLTLAATEELVVARALERWTGVRAWTDVSYHDGRVEATGWFET